MKASIRNKLALVAHRKFPGPIRVDPSFADSCIDDMLHMRSYTVAQVSQIFGVSEDWALRNVFHAVPGVMRRGRVFRIPESALKARIRALIDFSQLSS